MRKILFRAKRKMDGAWVYGTPSPDGKHFMRGWDNAFFNIGEIIPNTLGQYTGLSDKTGKKIFEGDIVKCQASIMTPSISKVKGAVEDSLILAYLDAEKYSGPFSWQFSEPDIAEVIGNIYDNADLLEYEEEQNGEEKNEKD